MILGRENMILIMIKIIGLRNNGLHCEYVLTPRGWLQQTRANKIPFILPGILYMYDN